MSKKIQQVDLDKIIKKIEKMGMHRWLLEELTFSFEEARKGKLKTFDEHHFEVHWIKNLVKLIVAIIEERYRPGPSTAFVVFLPTIREIFAARFRDRVVHHFLYRMQAGWWDRRFLQDSYACRKEKGTHYGMKRMQKMMRAAEQEVKRKAKAEGKDPNDPKLKPKIIKLDIKGYFMSLPRDKVFERIKWGLEQQFKDYMDNPAGYRLYKICEFLWKQVIFDDPVSKARKRGSLKNWDPEVLPPRKSLFCQMAGIGIVIGNLTSQLASNIYLDLLDRFVKFELGHKWYGRYVDDFFLIVPGEQYEQAKRDVKRIEEFLREELKLTLHEDKRYMQDVDKGVEFVGARVHPHCLYPSDRLQANFQRAIYGLENGWMEFDSVESYFGMMQNLNAAGYVGKVLRWGE